MKASTKKQIKKLKKWLRNADAQIHVMNNGHEQQKETIRDLEIHIDSQDIEIEGLDEELAALKKKYTNLVQENLILIKDNNRLGQTTAMISKALSDELTEMYGSK